MTDRYENIRRALAMFGPGNSTQEQIAALDNLDRACTHDTIRELLAERDALREALKVLVCWTPSADTYRRLGFDPEAPMRAHEAAKAALRYHDQKGNA